MAIGLRLGCASRCTLVAESDDGALEGGAWQSPRDHDCPPRRRRIEDLIDFDRATLRVSSREGMHREFKRQFERADFRQQPGCGGTRGSTGTRDVLRRAREVGGADPGKCAADGARTVPHALVADLDGALRHLDDAQLGRL